MITGSTKTEETTPIEELTGKLASDPEEKRLMKSVLENDEETISDGRIVTAAINTGISAFTPDMIFDKLVTNYKLAKKIYGESFLREISGYSESQLERNINISEFRQELKKRIKEKTEKMQQEGLLNEEGTMTEKALKLSKIILYTEELDKLAPKGLLGEQKHKKSLHQGTKEDTKRFAKERYHDIAIRKTIKLATRRQHTTLQKEDLQAFERKSKGRRNIIYALDASGSMKGQKLIECKKAGIALAHKAIQENDKIGLIVFGKETRKKIPPTNNFKELLDSIAQVTAKEKTNIAATIKEAATMFPKEEAAKHLILITDAMPTTGELPEKETLEAAATAADQQITISVIGINLRKEGEEIAKKIAEIGKGRLFAARNINEIDQIVLEDYYNQP